MGHPDHLLPKIIKVNSNITAIHQEARQLNHSILSSTAHFFLYLQNFNLMVYPLKLRSHRALKLGLSCITCSAVELCLTTCDPVDCSTPVFPVHHSLLRFSQAHVHWVGDAIQSSQPLSSPSPPAFNLSQHQDLFQRVSSALRIMWPKYWLELQPQHHSFQWIVRVDFL